jgi:hypothetical protein
MSFGEFERIYEANMQILEDEAVAPPKDDPQTAIISSDGSIEETPKDILNLLKNLGASDTATEDNKEKAPNESLEEQESFVTEATPAPKKKKTNTLKIAKMGEESDRVKEIQKALGVEVTGKFDQATKDAVMTFQKEQKKEDPSILVDGKVGVQTFGLLLKVKKGITDESEIERQIEEFRKAGKYVIAVGKGKSIALDPRFYDVFERIEIVTNNGTTYVVATPKADAATKVEGLKNDNLIGAGFEWLLAAPKAIGKALIYTVAGVTVVTAEVAKGIVNAAISAGAYVGQKVMSVASNVFYGIGQLAKWADGKASQIWTTVKTDALAIWKGFNEKAKEVLKASKEGILAFAASVSSSFAKASAAFRDYTHKMAVSVGNALNYAWDKTKHLGDLVKTGFAAVKDGVKAFASKVQNAYSEVVSRANAIGNSVIGSLKSAGNEIQSVFKAGVKATGDWLQSAGAWVSSLVESANAGNGELMLEWLEY